VTDVLTYLFIVRFDDDAGATFQFTFLLAVMVAVGVRLLCFYPLANKLWSMIRTPNVRAGSAALDHRRKSKLWKVGDATSPGETLRDGGGDCLEAEKEGAAVNRATVGLSSSSSEAADDSKWSFFSDTTTQDPDDDDDEGGDVQSTKKSASPRWQEPVDPHYTASHVHPNDDDEGNATDKTREIAVRNAVDDAHGVVVKGDDDESTVSRQEELVESPGFSESRLSELSYTLSARCKQFLDNCRLDYNPLTRLPLEQTEYVAAFAVFFLEDLPMFGLQMWYIVHVGNRSVRFSYFLLTSFVLTLVMIGMTLEKILNMNIMSGLLLRLAA